MSKVSVIILTNEPQKYVEEILKHLPSSTDNVVLDTSGDLTYSLSVAKRYGARVVGFPPEKFNHGGTRNFALNEARGDIVVFLTQDAVPEDDAVEKLVEVFKDKDISVAYGRQLPVESATVFAAHARLFNYPDAPYKRGYSDRTKYGMKTVFNSNSFAAYRKATLLSAGGFQENVILSEDMIAAAKLLKNGSYIAYVPSARVFHSHNFTLRQEFKRYFDIGVFHAKEKWLLEEFGKAEGEGLRFVISELKYLIREGKWYLVPVAFTRSFNKYLGYFCGKHSKSTKH